MKTTTRTDLSPIDQKALWASVFSKLSPRQVIKNPVMAVVWLGTLICFGLTLSGHASLAFGIAVSAILLATVLFANLAESLAESRGQAQAASLRAVRKNLTARRLESSGGLEEVVSASSLKKGDLVRVLAGEFIPVDGEIVLGMASVSEAAVTGESAPVLREAGTDHSSVIGGTKVLSDEITVMVSSDPGHGFLDKMIAMVEGASRQKTPNEVALGQLINIMTATFVIVVASLPLLAQPFGVEVSGVVLIALLVCLIPTTIGGLLPAIGIAGMNRALKHNLLAKSGKAVEVAGDLDVLLLDKTGTITFGDRMATAIFPVSGVDLQKLRCAAWVTSVFDPTPEGKSIVKLCEATDSYGLKPNQADFTPFSASTRMSGITTDDGIAFTKGARDAVCEHIQALGGQVPPGLDSVVEEVARRGSTPLVVAQNAQILGVVELSDVIKPGIKERFARLRAMGIETVMITGDNALTAASIAAKAGVDDYMAQARPEDKLARIRQEQQQGRLVAMVGDGTNDAPALAQADVGLAMNSGTQAAKEAGNMVDLDSDPTKLLEVVEIGKQQLITRGALTTFSLANDVSKYFAILPVLFAAAIPGMSSLNIMNLSTPESAVLSALLFNALIIPALIPLAFRGVKFKPASANSLLRNNMLVYGFGGVLLPFVAIKALDLVVSFLMQV